MCTHTGKVSAEKVKQCGKLLILTSKNFLAAWRYEREVALVNFSRHYKSLDIHAYHL